MKSIIRELYHGNINPYEKTFKRDSEYGKIIEKLTDLEEKLLEILSEEEKSLFQAFSDAQSSLNEISTADGFVEGFKLGMRMVVEVLILSLSRTKLHNYNSCGVFVLSPVCIN